MRRTVLITGASRGIGHAIAQELGEAGYDLVLNYLHSRTQAEQLQQDLQQRCGIRALAIQADVADEQQVDRMVRQAEEQLGGIDILINNAGVDLANLFRRKSSEEFRRTLDVNVLGAYFCARRVSEHMLEQHYGRIINISSTNGMNTYYPMSIDYDASKAALNSLTHDLAVQFAPDIHVNAVAPGFIGTASELDGYDEEFLRQECEKILVRRYGKPEEVAHLVRFLISDEADFINNTILRIDGGQMGSC